jgi:acetyl esterase/lipase
MVVSRRVVLTGLMGLWTSACSRLALFAANLPAAFGSYRRNSDLAYGTRPHERLDVYVPDGPATSRPLVVFWYGGRWTHGDKGDYKFVGAALAALGCVAVLPNYRHYPDVKLAGFMEDAALAALWAQTHASEFGADPERFYLMGHSAGAHIAALVTLDQRYFRAAGRVPPIAGLIGLSGPYDFLPLTDADLEDMFGPPERYADSQPINFVRADAPPALLVQGLKDTYVAPKNSVNLAAALEAKGVSVTLKLYPALSHADTVAALSIPARRRASTLADIASFVNPPPSS